MTLRLYNTLTRQLEALEPIEPNAVKIYCCGVTVYDFCHLGHARSYVVWDVLRRYLTWCGDRVRYVQNFTDIDDKILKRAREEGSSMQAVSKRYTEAYFEDMEKLNILRADSYPRATEFLNGIQRLIRELETKERAYAAGGDVYFRVREFPSYGKLSGRKLEEMEAGRSGREIDSEAKEHPFDFALWKAAKPGEPFWESDWGRGRPGWHIECSAMARDTLGDTLDIHCGGADLVFPHHENEIAQSEAATGKPLANHWLHNGMVTVGGEKMSKSLGNFTTIRQLLERGVEPMALRLFVLQAHYRKPLDFTDDAIASAENGWNTLREGLQFGGECGQKLGWEEVSDRPTSDTVSNTVSNVHLLDAYRDRFRTAMDDDLNTSEALAVLFELAKNLRRDRNLLAHEGKTDTPPETLQRQWQTLVALAAVLGLEARSPAETATEPATGPSDAEIDRLLEKRQAARKAKNFAEADRIRDELQKQGITVIDRPGGVAHWHRS